MVSKAPMASKPHTNPSELQIALDNRAFEIQMFWQRSNYFLVLMTALGIGVFAIKDSWYSLLISIFATVTSWYWYKTNLGSKFWHESWEVEVVALAKEQGIRSFERPIIDVVAQVKSSFDDAYSSGDKDTVRRWIDRQVLKKPSVSHYMILLSLTSMLLWAIVSISYGVDFARSALRPPSKASAVRRGVGKPTQASVTANLLDQREERNRRQYCHEAELVIVHKQHSDKKKYGSLEGVAPASATQSAHIPSLQPNGGVEVASGHRPSSPETCVNLVSNAVGSQTTE